MATATNDHRKAYQLARREVRKQLTALRAKLTKHQQDFTSTGGHWGYVGDMNKIAADIKEIVSP